MTPQGTFRAVCAALALAFFAQPAAAQVPEPFARQLARQLAEADQVVGNDNYQRAAGPFAGGVAEGERRSFNVTLRAGQDYRVVGVCDDQCGDLDLRGLDPNGETLDADLLHNAMPALSLEPELTGQHTIEVAMAQCGAPRCWFAFNVYAR